MKVCVCGSIGFYRKFLSLKSELEELGYEVIIPVPAKDQIEKEMPQSSLKDEKAKVMRDFFKFIEESDVILVANYPKHGKKGYIGANTFLEIGVAFSKNKKIFLLHNLPENSPFIDELDAMNCIALNGDISKIAADQPPHKGVYQKKTGDIL